jgi:hypothetical protein
MAYRSLRDFIAELEAAGELVRVTEPVSTVLEMTEIQTRLLAEGGPAVLFENVIRADGEPSDMPCLVNLFGTVKRVAMGVTLGGEARTTAGELREVGESRTAFLLRYTLSHPHVHTTIVGTLYPEHLHENLAMAAKGPLAPGVYALAKERLTAAGLHPAV